MIGLWLQGSTLTLRKDLPRPDPPEGEALVRVLAAGICNTDLELLKGYSRFTGVPGHEFVGVVERGPAPLIGRRVVGEINAACRKCATCAAGRPSHCPVRTVLGILKRHGAFAEHLILPIQNLHLVPDEVSDADAVFAEPLAAALEIQEQVRIGPGDRVLVAGDGKLGQLVARTLALTGCDLLVAGRHAGKLALLNACGIRTAAPGEIAAGAFDVAVECTGGPGGFHLARRALRPRGTLVMKSTYAGELSIDAPALVVDEITLVGSRCGPFGKALALLGAGKVSPAPLVQARFPLAEALAAFDRARTPGTLKVIVEMGSEPPVRPRT